MKNFRLIAKLETAQRQVLLDEAQSADMWLVHQHRQKKIPPTRESQSVPLRLQVYDGEVKIWDRQKTENHFLGQFPLLADFLCMFAESHNTTLGLAMIVRLKPHGQVYSHHDHGSYYRQRDRFHLVLSSPNGSDFTSGNEACTFREGELWWFNNDLIHQAFNHSEEWRVHVIFDLNATIYKLRSADELVACKFCVREGREKLSSGQKAE